MRTDGFITPNNAQAGKYGKLRSACQELDGVSLFDFTSESTERVLGEAAKWQQFLGCSRPLTVVVGLARHRLPEKLVAYPENRDITPKECSGPIPWVEVCHCGPMPISAIARHLLVCAADYRRFKTLEVFDESALAHAETEYAKAAQAGIEEQAKLFAKVREVTQSPEFKAQMEQANRRVEEMRKRK